MKTSVTVLLVLLCFYSRAQRYPVIGQRPSSAFPVCGQEIFTQAVVPLGSSGALQVPGCGNYADVNPFWYTFTCYSAGTLGFLIKPKNPGDDYDWMLFDVTNRNVNDIYRDISMVVTGNWAGTYGNTGAVAGASPKIQCGSDPKKHVTTFTAMPVLKKGHQYLLLISHYTGTQSGYRLSFQGGTAVINDSTMPALISATPLCDNQTLNVKLSKKLRCNSLAADGTDFTIPGTAITVVSATGTNCTSAFDMDLLQVKLSAPLAPGSYTLIAITGSDGNTILDDCGSQVPVGSGIPLTIVTPLPTPLDSLTAVTCAPKNLELVFADPIQCSSIAADGSDFKIIGNPGVTVSGAAGNCGDDYSNIITVSLSAPLVRDGSYQIMLVTGSDGNTILNQCGLQTPAGGTIPFFVRDTVSADYDFSVAMGCRYDTITLKYSPASDLINWNWTIDSSNFQSLEMEPVVIESEFGLKNLQHIVSNGFCRDTVTKTIDLNNKLTAAFSSDGQVCPKDVLQIADVSLGRIVKWAWDFGDGTLSADKSPQAHQFPDTWAGKTYTVQLAVLDDLGCRDTVSKDIIKLQSCYITVPNAFTPNGDGKNDYLYPLNGFMGTDMQFIVYNRYGQRVFESRDWSRKWDGRVNGIQQAFGTYVWTLSYTDAPSGKKFFLKGTSVLIR